MIYISCNKIKQMTKWMFPQMMFFLISYMEHLVSKQLYEKTPLFQYSCIILNS